MTLRIFVAAGVAVLAFMVAGCGYKGPLTLPEQAGPVVTRPAAPATPPPTATPAASPGAATPTDTAAPPAPQKPEDDEQTGPATAPAQGPAPAAVQEGSPAGG